MTAPIDRSTLMHLADLVRLTTGSVRAHRLRAMLTALGIGIGVTAVVLLTAIGESVHRFVRRGAADRPITPAPSASAKTAP